VSRPIKVYPLTVVFVLVLEQIYIHFSICPVQKVYPLPVVFCFVLEFDQVFIALNGRRPFEHRSNLILLEIRTLEAFRFVIIKKYFVSLFSSKYQP